MWGLWSSRRSRKATRPQRLARSLSLSPISARTASCWGTSWPPLIVSVPKPSSFDVLVRVYSRFAYVREQASRDGFPCLIRDKRSRRRLASFKREVDRKSHSWKPQEDFLSPVAFVPYRRHPLFPHCPASASRLSHRLHSRLEQLLPVAGHGLGISSVLIPDPVSPPKTRGAALFAPTASSGTQPIWHKLRPNWTLGLLGRRPPTSDNRVRGIRGPTRELSINTRCARWLMRSLPEGEVIWCKPSHKIHDSGLNKPDRRPFTESCGRVSRTILGFKLDL